LMVECGSAGVWDRGIIGMCNVFFMGSGVYCLFTVMSTMVDSGCKHVFNV
jgi:hypothetical protein